jgi:hopanoid biosynthesis associated protein HpnK
MKRLIITGDDFGRDHKVNEEVERLHCDGVLTRASLMVDGAAAEEAVRIARRNPRLGIGLHLTLCDGQSSLGQLPRTPLGAGLQYAFSRQAKRRLAKEIEHQFDRFDSLGFVPDSWDGHTHLHLHPTVLRCTLPIAHRLGYRWTRLVREPGLRHPLGVIFHLLARSAQPELQRYNIGSTDHLFGFRDTGRMTMPVMRALLDRIPEGTSELYFHPGAEPEPIDARVLTERIAASRIELRSSLYATSESGPT